MNLKILTIALASSLAAAHSRGPPPPPPPPPKCKIGTDTQPCTLPDGGAGMFLCHPPPPPPPRGGHHGDHPPHQGGDIVGQVGGAILRVAHMIVGDHHHDDDKRHHHHDHHGHDRNDHHHHHKKGPHRALRSHSISSSSSSSSSSRSGPHGPRNSPRSGPFSWHHRADEHHHDHHHGKHDEHHDHKGRHARSPPPPHGPPEFLSPTRCVPVDGPPKDHTPPPHPFHGGNPPPPHPHHPEPPTCGCCGDVCPIKLDCACTCDLTDPEGAVVDPGAGVWVDVGFTSKNSTQPQTTKKCVPANSYADANRVQCVTECSLDTQEQEEGLLDLWEDRVEEQQEDDWEKESRD